MPDGSATLKAGCQGQVGPNAILQLARPVDDILGPGAMARLLARCTVAMPDGQSMIDQQDVIRVHRSLAQDHPDHATAILTAAGFETARYICTHRIPGPARLALRLLPVSIAERMLTRAIAAHAWTFCGSGRLEVQRGQHILRFAIHDNPLTPRAAAASAQCHWHSAVFAQLFSQLLRRPYRVREITCCAIGAPACAFEVKRQR